MRHVNGFELQVVKQKGRVIRLFYAQTFHRRLHILLNIFGEYKST